VDVDGRNVAHLRLVDPVRPEAADMVTALRKAGVNRVVLVTGDRWEAAEAVGRTVGVDAVVADCDPAAKAAVVARERAWGPTIMVGDGVNDAPALAAADVGVALAARGRSASGEVADVVLTVDRLDALADAARIARRARAVAGQAAGVGMGLSAVAMVVAAAGLLAPAAGALLQEGIDVIAIMLALRSVGPRRPAH
jgi:magnesium-transporting ATPase (P-type)